MDKGSTSSREAIPAATHDGKDPAAGPFKSETNPGNDAGAHNFTGAGRRASAAGTHFNVIENPLAVRLTLSLPFLL